MTSLLQKLLFKGEKPKQFIPVRIGDISIKEKVIIRQGGDYLDITHRHSIVSQTPFCVALFLSAKEFNLLADDSLQMQVVAGDRTVSSLSLKKIHLIKYDDSFITLYRIVKVHNYGLNFLQREVALRLSFKNKSTNYFERKVYAGLYAYPRKVIVVSYAEKDYINIFPMDFQCFIPGPNIYLLGLRTSNITLDKIVNSRRLVVSDSASAKVDVIYSLGTHHKKPLNVNELPFTVAASQLYKFPVPGFANDYKELELVEFYKSGSHMLLVAKTINSISTQTQHSSLHHIHFFQFDASRYPLA